MAVYHTVRECIISRCFELFTFSCCCRRWFCCYEVLSKTRVLNPMWRQVVRALKNVTSVELKLDVETLIARRYWRAISTGTGLQNFLPSQSLNAQTSRECNTGFELDIFRKALRFLNIYSNWDPSLLIASSRRGAQSSSDTSGSFRSVWFYRL